MIWRRTKPRGTPPAAGLLFSVLTLGPWLAACDRPEVEVEETPVRIVDEEPGYGREAQTGDVVRIDYRIIRDDGVQILEEENFRFILGRGAVIKGIDDGVAGMRVGGTRIIDCPPHLHWGRAPYGGNEEIPYNTTLRMEIALTGVDPRGALASGG